MARCLGLLGPCSLKIHSFYTESASACNRDGGLGISLGLYRVWVLVWDVISRVQLPTNGSSRVVTPMWHIDILRPIWAG